MIGDTRRVRTPFFPLYSEVRYLLRIWEGVPKSTVSGMINAIEEQTGTPQKPVNWSRPDLWIKKRLSGEAAELAMRIWQESDKQVNPRHVYGSYLFVNNYSLLENNVFGAYQVSPRGRSFLDREERTVRELDEAEGIPQLLGILAGKTSAKRGDLIPEWRRFLREYSKFGAPVTVKETLRRRLLNLMERGCVTRDGIVYSITRNGMDYAEHFAVGGVGSKREVIRAITSFNRKQQKELLQLLGRMPLRYFENLVGELLEAMGYEDVTITRESGDKGVEVVAMTQFGITTVKEVLRVVRQQGNIGRPQLDRLRGLLPQHNAIKGVLITLGKFTRNCREDAVREGNIPIALIDGDGLVELLSEHGIGLRETPASLYQVDEDYFKTPPGVGFD